MRSKLPLASGIAVAATFLTAVFSAQGSGAFAEEKIPAIIPQAADAQFVSLPVVQALPAANPTQTSGTPGGDSADQVATQAEAPELLDRDMRCLASAIYFEARGESTKGQLAVARVIIQRTKSGRFPTSYCGVVYQHAQFSFVRGNRIPVIPTGSPAWRRAVSVARIAHAGGEASPVEGALFFHAARVSPGWGGLHRLAQVDNHVFYR